MDNHKSELENLITEYKAGAVSGLDRKCTTITFRCSPSLKSYLITKAGELGLNMNEYIEHCLTIAENEHKHKKANKELEKAHEQTKTELAAHNRARKELEQIFGAAYEQAKTKGIGRLNGSPKPQSFDEFLKMVASLLTI